MNINLSKYYKFMFYILTWLWYWSLRIMLFNSDYGHKLFIGYCKEVAAYAQALAEGELNE